MDPRIVTNLRIHDACVGLADEEIEEIAAKAEILFLDAGEVVHSEQDKLQATYLVAKGRLKLSLVSPAGVETTLRFVSAGDQFGAIMLVLDDEERFPVRATIHESAALLRFSSRTCWNWGNASPS